MTLKRVLFVPDSHHPFVSKSAWACLLRAARKFKPDITVILGDFADCYSVSSHSKDPKRAGNFKSELDAVKKALRELRAAVGDGEIHYIFGNHEDRYDRFLAQKAPELSGVASLEELLGLDNLDITTTPYKQHFKLGRLYMTHEVGKAGKYAHYDAQAAFEGNVVIGHTHRLGYAVVGSARGKPHLGAMFGWLGDIESVDYMHRIRALRDWSHGFGVGYLDSEGNIHCQPVPIINGRAIIEGEFV